MNKEKIEKVFLGSDNYSSVHPFVLHKLFQVNEGYAFPYGGDEITKRMQKIFGDLFERECKALFVATGSAANVLALKIACMSFHSCICTDIAHLTYQECGAAEAFVGCKLLIVPHKGGKLVPEMAREKILSERAFAHHSTKPRILSITQPTEVGTVYTLEEIKELKKLCEEENLLFHMDGSRIYNALAALKCSWKEMISDLDFLSLGGTKNGLMIAEALIIFNSHFYDASLYMQKQMTHLLSKMRYIAVQYEALFTDNLWHVLANQANKSAHEIAKILEQSKDVSFLYPVESNQIFFKAPLQKISLMSEQVVCTVWNKQKGEVRFVTSWNTTAEEINKVADIFTNLFNLVL